MKTKVIIFTKLFKIQKKNTMKKQCLKSNQNKLEYIPILYIYIINVVKYVYELYFIPIYKTKKYI